MQNGGTLTSMNDWNELAMSALLRMSEKKQRDHVHLGDIERSSHGKYDVRLVYIIILMLIVVRFVGLIFALLFYSFRVVIGLIAVEGCF